MARKPNKRLKMTSANPDGPENRSLLVLWTNLSTGLMHDSMLTGKRMINRNGKKMKDALNAVMNLL